MFEAILNLFIWIFYKKEYVTTWQIYYTETKSKDSPMKSIKLNTLDGWRPTALFRNRFPKAIIHNSVVIKQKQLKRWEDSKTFL